MYGVLRPIAYARPLKKEEYVIDRVGRTIMYTLTAPWAAPIWMYQDLKNLEHVVRKMPDPSTGVRGDKVIKLWNSK